MPQFLTSYFYFFVHYKNTFSAQATCTAPYDVHKVSCPVKLKFQSGTVQKIHYTIDLFSDWRSHAGKKKKTTTKQPNTQKKTNLLEIVMGGGVMRAWKRRILFWYELVGQHTLGGILQTFIVNRNDPGTRSDLCEAVGSMIPLLPPPSSILLLALETRSARGYTHPDCRPLFKLCWCAHVCVCVCVCPGPLVYPWPPCTVITTHSCHLPLSLSLSLSLGPLPPPLSTAMTGMISTVDPNVSSHD